MPPATLSLPFCRAAATLCCMAPRLRDTSLGIGVYYARSDYVGFGRRTIALLVDGFILWAMISALWLAWATVRAPPAILPPMAMLGAWLYLVVCKRSSWRTVGLERSRGTLVSFDGQAV